jgi:hypothetical protein
MNTMRDEKLSISWDDLTARRVDNRLREQDAMQRNRAYSQMKEDALPEATKPKSSIWNNAVFCMTLFGLAGGLLAWGAEALVAGPLTPVVGSMLHYDPRAKADAKERIDGMHDIEARLAIGQLDQSQAQIALDEFRADGRNNPYFVLEIDEHLTDARRKFMRDELETNDRFAAFLINLLSYGLCGMMIALSLAVAEPITQRKTRAAWINAGAGAAVGLIGGVAAALLADRLSVFADTVTKGQAGWIRTLTMQAAAWGMLGLFLGLGSGLVMRSFKKIAVGMAGGLLGGLIGGALFLPIQNMASDVRISRLVALLAIGIVAGLATGLLENVIKAGWLKVTSGVIAGKQFILYRNPTYIGSSPDCQIYLFKDAQVGKRHAALHLLPTGIEIEDLPLGTATLVNGAPVRRSRLKSGDTIQIGSTSFRFLEKRPVN